ncbi:MAG: peptidylprolyl isomerase [Saprospiraceae bacterium]
MVFTKKTIGFWCVIALLFASCSKPTASFRVPNNTIKTAPAKITFENKSKKAESYEWDFGDGKISGEETPTHQYFKPGKYTITLKAIKEGKINTKTQEIEIEAPEECLIEMETSMGTMIILLYSSTPNHRDNFIKLAEEGFYDDLLFHRVMNGFMVQGGDPNSRNASANARLGSGGPGYQVSAEFVDSLVHVKGALAAARQPDRVNPQLKSSGSQFYIVHGGSVSKEQLDQFEKRTGVKYTDAQRKKYYKMGGAPQLDRNYVVYGQVISGMEVIDKIAATTVIGTRPKTDVKMKVSVIK